MIGIAFKMNYELLLQINSVLQFVMFYAAAISFY
jgi:hypothetical protein